MRKFTGHEVRGVVDEGRTGRIVARRILRKGLGNPKKRVRDLREFGLELYIKGVQFGGEYMRGRIHNSVAALDYGPGYFVQPEILEEVNGESPVLQCSDPESDGGLAGAVAVDIHTDDINAIAAAADRLDSQPVPFDLGRSSNGADDHSIYHI
jgi:hypothetical protein